MLTFITQFPADLIDGGIKIKTDAYEVQQLLYAISQIHVFEEGKLIYYEDYLKYKVLIKVFADLRKKLVKCESAKKEEINLTLAPEELLVIFEQVNYSSSSHRYLIRLMDKISMAAYKLSTYILME